MKSDHTHGKAKAALESFDVWFRNYVEPLAREHKAQLEAWEGELEAVRDLLKSRPKVRIALVGTTGAGKSTFLNALLGQQVLPVGVMQPCTAFVTAVRRSDDCDYHLSVDFVAADEWRRELENIVSALRPGDEDDPLDSRGEGKRIVEVARKRAQAVFGTDPDDLANPDLLLEMPLPPESARVLRLSGPDRHRFSTAKEMLAHVRKLVRGESSLWPLVKQVELAGPYDALAGELELVDLPGLNDPNEARVEVTRNYLSTCAFVWVLFPMVRGMTEDVRQILRDGKLLRTLVLNGNQNALALIGTKADEIDNDCAEQLGLPEDVIFPELVRAYRRQTIGEGRKSLVELTRDLARPGEDGQTLERMIEVARQTPIITTSANAYMKIRGIGGVRKDYGLEKEEDTGIPEIHRLLTEVACRSGGMYAAKQTLERLGELRDEVVFFFRGQAQEVSASVVEAKRRFAQEQEGFNRTIREAHKRAQDQLAIRRDGFVKKLDPLFASSVHSVRRGTVGWATIHWSTLRAIVQRDGIFRSPSSGRPYDFNEELAEPLLSHLPVSWEQYFTDELGGVTQEFLVHLAESVKSFCKSTRLIVDLLFQKESSSLDQQLEWFEHKVSVMGKAAQERVLTEVQTRRRELATKIPLVAKGHMAPAYGASKGLRGAGIKKRIVEKLQGTAVEAAKPIYSNLQQDLMDGLADLENVIAGMYIQVVKAAETQANIMANNANIGVDDEAANPAIRAVLEAVPTW